MTVAKADPVENRDLNWRCAGGVMARNKMICKVRKPRGEKGIGTAELLVVVAIVGVLSAFAAVSFRSSRATIRVQNSVRQLASYMEKARIDAVRRHGESRVRFTSPTSYTVRMDFDNTGVPIDRTFSFEPNVSVASGELPEVVFNWRGRTLTSGTSCVTTFSVKSDTNSSYGLNVDVSGSGDVTVENQQPALPNVPYNDTISASAAIKSTTTVSGTQTSDNTPCMDVSGEGVGGEQGPPECLLHLGSTSVSVKKNGGATANVNVTMSISSRVTATFPSNLTVTPSSQIVSTGSSFAIKSNNTLRGPFYVTFTSVCGSSMVLKVNVTN